MRPYLISGIDIGNAQVKVVMANIDRETLMPEILGVGSAFSNGLRRGMVVDMEETINDVHSAIQRAEAMAGVKIKKAYLSVSGLHVRTQVSRGVIAVSRADQEISQNDIDRVIQAASVISMPANREILHVIPRNYIVDGTECVKNPLGMKGVRLEVEVFIIDGLSPYLRNITKCINENGVEVAELVYSPLAAALSVLEKSQKEYGGLNIDFGGGTSNLTVFEEADLLHSAVLPIGSKHITNDLAVALRTSLDIAERIKLEHGSTSEGEDLRKREILDLSELIGEENFVLPKKQLIRVIDARIHEILDMVGDELKKVSKNGMLPAGVVLSGGGANLPGLVSLVKERLRLPVKIAKPVNFKGVTDNISDPSFSVVAGLISWGLDREFGSAKPQDPQFLKEGFLRKTMDWLKNFLP